MPHGSYQFTLFGKRYYFTTKFAALTFLLIIGFIYLGHLELSASQKKQELAKLFAARTNSTPITVSDLKTKGSDFRFYTISLQGNFDNHRTLFLPKKNNQGLRGYEVLTPLKTAEGAILVDRGFVQAAEDANQLPKISITDQPVVLTGILDVPEDYLGSGELYDEQKSVWPIIVINHVDFAAISKLIGYNVLPYLVLLDPQNPYGFIRDWSSLHTVPEQGTTHAIAWFLLTIATFLIFVFYNIHRVRE